MELAERALSQFALPRGRSSLVVGVMPNDRTTSDERRT